MTSPFKAEPLPIDESVPLPPSVRAAAERAEAFYKKPEEDKSAEAPATPEAPAAEAAPVTPQVTPPPPPPEENWEHRYKSMKGRFDSSQAQLQQMQQSMLQMQQQMEMLQRQRVAEPPPQQQPERLITPQEEQEYGTEFLDIVGRKAKEIAAAETARLNGRIAELEGHLRNVGSKVAGDAQHRMYETFDTNLTNWREINSDPQFLNWLSLPDSYSGVIRRSLLQRAYEQNDAPRVLAFFRGFLSEVAAVDPARHGPDHRAQGSPKVPLESLAAPGRAKSAAGTTPPAEKPIITRAQIAKFYADAAAGRWAGRDKEKDAFERQIMAAQADGRIQ